IAGAALALSAAAGVPATADSHGSHSKRHDTQSSSQPQRPIHSSTSRHSSGGHGASESAAASSKASNNSSDSSSGHNPPGNNGTVFIHDVAGDHSPHNVPHVGCTFYVDFFGFD